MKAGRNQSVGVRKVLAGEASAGQRLDNFLLRELQGVPRSRVPSVASHTPLQEAVVA